jgi:hypothetical protein
MPAARQRERLAMAHQEDRMLATWRAKGIIPARRYAVIYGITQNRFENASGLLRVAAHRCAPAHLDHQRPRHDQTATQTDKGLCARKASSLSYPAFNPCKKLSLTDV